MKYYSGIGSRSTPPEILEMMSKVAKALESFGYILRTGDAGGADAAFRNSVVNKEVYTANDATPKALELASRIHPAWDRCSDFAKKLHARNGFQLLGRNLDNPSSAVICWTPDGAQLSHETSIKTGGSGQIIRLSTMFNVKVFNLQRIESRISIQSIIDKVNSQCP